MFWDWSAPDMIRERPNLYENYVNELAKILIEKFESAEEKNLLKVWNKVHELSMYAVLQDVSLIGIINYEVALVNGEDSFVVHKVNSFLPSSAAYKNHLQNTIDYLNTKGVEHTIEEKDSGSVFSF